LEEFRSIIGGNGNGAGNASNHASDSAMSRGKESLWQVWRSGFQAIHIVQASAITEAQRLQSAS
jgi:hypothetical protein